MEKNNGSTKEKKNTSQKNTSKSVYWYLGVVNRCLSNTPSHDNNAEYYFYNSGTKHH